jgi:putative RNA 2'-phosphotransferase
MDRELVRLSKTVSHALRHAPWQYELELDAEGWVTVDALLAALRERRPAWELLRAEHLAEMVDGRIRALYGHSLPDRLAKTPAEPPEILYHGTSALALDAIRAEGLKPMSRQYVHLSTDEATAIQVARRKRGESAILRVKAGEAYRQGQAFYIGNERVWLADGVPPTYLLFPDS